LADSDVIVYVSKKTAEVISPLVANPEKFSRFF